MVGWTHPVSSAVTMDRSPHFKKKFAYLAASRLSCSTQDFCCIIQDLSLQSMVSS